MSAESVAPGRMRSVGVAFVFAAVIMGVVAQDRMFVTLY